MAAKQKKWEVRMHEQRGLRKRGAEMLYDRVTLLVECYEDQEFRAWCAESGTNELDFLDEELSDTAATFMTLRSVLLANRDRGSWVKHNIRDLIADVMEAESAKGADETKSTARMSWKARAIQAEAECERLRAEIASMKESLGIVAGAKCC